jgi:hypothetical protein
MFSHLLDPPMRSSSPSAPDAPTVDLATLVELAVGRIVELSSGADVAQASAVVSLLLALQARGEHVAWVAPRSAGLFPPDWARAGLDLDALLVVHVPDHDPSAAPRAAELLLRTGVMGAVVLDLSNVRARTSAHAFEARDAGANGRGSRRDNVLRGDAWLGRLFGLAREHGSRLVLLSPHDHAAPSLGPLVSLRLAVRHASDEHGLVRDHEGRLSLTTVVLKDKTGMLHLGAAPRVVITSEPRTAETSGLERDHALPSSVSRGGGSVAA